MIVRLKRDLSAEGKSFERRDRKKRRMEEEVEREVNDD